MANELRIGVAVALLLSVSATADYRDLTRKGNQAWMNDDTETALKLYSEAEIEQPDHPILHYNIATALFKKADFDLAAERFRRSLHTDDPSFRLTRTTIWATATSVPPTISLPLNRIRRLSS